MQPLKHFLLGLGFSLGLDGNLNREKSYYAFSLHVHMAQIESISDCGQLIDDRHHNTRQRKGSFRRFGLLPDVIFTKFWRQ